MSSNDKSLVASGKILRTDTPQAFREAAEAAACRLRQGEAVVLPTETVYGLAANALDPLAVANIYQIKGRPSRNPLIVHVCSLEMARDCAGEWPEVATKLACAFWPGPLTMVVAKSKIIPNVVTAGGATVGLRWPDHPMFVAVLKACGFPLAAPSANRSNQVSPTAAEHVVRSLGDRCPMVVDGGNCNVGIESTVVDVSGDQLRVLRPGMIQVQAMETVLGRKIIADQRDEPRGDEEASGALRSPGLLEIHYAPKAVLWLGRWQSELSLREAWEKCGPAQGKVAVIAHHILPVGFERVSVLPHDPEAYARGMYAEWHRCDELGYEFILLELPPNTPEWGGIHDRLKRAARGMLLFER